ncbi:MAG: hypothetical protein LBL35_09300 [Clostridiales bacterium]|jgi:hypothetical protein|nr:hypothetical protein [Clostridiales bacterium]
MKRSKSLFKISISRLFGLLDRPVPKHDSGVRAEDFPQCGVSEILNKLINGASANHTRYLKPSAFYGGMCATRSLTV